MVGRSKTMVHGGAEMIPEVYEIAVARLNFYFQTVLTAGLR
jgi:hypothetical protein